MNCCEKGVTFLLIIMMLLIILFCIFISTGLCCKECSDDELVECVFENEKKNSKIVKIQYFESSESLAKSDPKVTKIILKSGTKIDEKILDYLQDSDSDSCILDSGTIILKEKNNRHKNKEIKED